MQDPDRIYSEEEIGRVLKRAAEIQGKQPKATTYGLSLAEMQELARDSGIDPGLVAAAVLELNSDQVAREKNWWGGPMTHTLIRSVDGPISDDTWEELLAVLRRTLKETGSTEQRGTTRQWMSKTQEGGQSHLIATYRDGRTELELMSGNPTNAVPFAILPIITSVIALPVIFAGMGLSGLPGVLVWLAWFTSMVSMGRFGVGMVSDRGHAESKELIEDLMTIAQRSAAQERRLDKSPTDAERAQPALEATAQKRSRKRKSGAYLQIPEDEFGDSAGPSEAAADRDRDRES
jgi:hypothetical protein